jgi:glycosyltransferase involved in cell wall biosynthesis
MDNEISTIDNAPTRSRPLRTPTVSIGIPVFNGEMFLRRALDSLLAQTFNDFELVISDNASSDSTGAICVEYEKKDPRIRYVRQERNLGPKANFAYVLEVANGEYFMFAAADDIWHPTFIERNLDKLRGEPNCVASCSDVAFIKDGAVVSSSTGTFEIRGGVRERLRRFLKRPTDNSRFYGLHRRVDFQYAFREGAESDFHAFDWYLVCVLLSRGEQCRVDDCLMWREISESDRYLRAVASDNKNHCWLIFPILPMSRALIGKLPFTSLIGVLPALVGLNIRMSIAYVRWVFIKVLSTRDL